MKLGKTIDELQIGDQASYTRVIADEEITHFKDATGDANPAHFSDEYASQTMFQKRIAHGMLVGSLFSTIFGMTLPGKGTIYVSQFLQFKRPVFIGDEITATVTIKEVKQDKNRIIVDCIATNEEGKKVIVGEAELMPPKKEE